jgi:hypothetical protein
MKRLLAATCAAVMTIALLEGWGGLTARAANVGQVPVPGFGLVDGNWLTALAGGQNYVYVNGLTAHAGGGQSSALALPSNTALIQVGTVASGNDSVALPYCVAPSQITLQNNAASNALQFYANAGTNPATATTDTVNGNANTTAYTLPAQGITTLTCFKNGAWSAAFDSSGSGTLVIADGKTVTFSNTLTFNGTDSTTFTFPSVTGTVVTLGATQTLTTKTLTTPTINGATVSGTFAGAFTTSGVQTPTGGFAAAGGFTASPRNIWSCGVSYNGATSAFTAQTPVATEVYITEVFIPANVTVTGVTMFNSGTISGNVKVGLANSSGVNVATSASTAQSGTSTIQLVPFTGTYAAVGPATYYITTFFDNNTTRPWAVTLGSCGASKQTAQTYATGFTTVTPPTTFTTALGTVSALY